MLGPVLGFVVLAAGAGIDWTWTFRLRGIRRRVEAGRPPRPSGRVPIATTTQ